MAAGAVIKHKRKAGAFVNGELAAGEWGLDTTNSVWYFSVNGTTVVSLSSSYSDEQAQDAIGAMSIDTNTINVIYTDATPELKWDVITQMSITSDSSGIKLSGDESSPGNNNYYGTDGTGTKGYYELLGIQTETGTSKTLAATDDGKETRYTNAGTKTLTLDDTATVGTGHISKHTNLGAGALTIASGGMTVRNNLATVPQYGSVLILAIGTDEFLVIPSITDSNSARTWLGVEIGTDVQAWSANLDEYAAVNPTSAGLALLDDASAAVQRATLGVDVCSFVWVIDGGGSAITTGVKGDLQIPYACTITGWKLGADQSGSIVIDVWKDTYANFPPTVADTIAGSEKPTLSSAQKNEDTSLSTWTTSVSAGDWLRFNVDSASTVTRVTLIITAIR